MSSLGMTASEPIQRRKLSHEVLDRLLVRIRAGEWQPGSHLPSERELMAAFGVGRPAIREALQSLERMGLISITHGERARVSAISAQSVIAQVGDVVHHVLTTSPETLLQFREARLFFEVGMVRIAAERASQADLDRIRAAIDAQRAADVAAFLQHDMEFHRAIAQASGNVIFVAVSQAIFEWVQQFHFDLVRLPGAEKLTIGEHTRIYDRIAAHDPDGAAKAITAHLTRTDKAYRALEQQAAVTAQLRLAERERPWSSP
jgi:GntR family transcriptional regulator, sialic acid-inducible nan operon repressor